MLLTKKSEYALLSLVSISNGNGLKTVDNISKELNISKSYLAKVLQAFTKKGILKSYKGVNGGFVLNKPSNEITILEIITIAEEKMPMVFECTTLDSTCSGASNSGCTIWPLLNNLQNKIDNFLSKLTLKDIMT